MRLAYLLLAPVLFPILSVLRRSWLNMAIALQRYDNAPFAAERYYITAMRMAPGNPSVITNAVEFLRVAFVHDKRIRFLSSP